MINVLLNVVGNFLVFHLMHSYFDYVVIHLIDDMYYDCQQRGSFNTLTCLFKNWASS